MMEFKHIVSTVAKNYREQSENEAKRIGIWSKEVQKLYKEVEDWLNENIKKNEIIIEYGESQHYDEDNFTCSLYVTIGDEDGPSIVFEPTGTNVSDAIGKIELYFRGHKEELVHLLLFKENGDEYKWKLMKNSNNIIIFSRKKFEEQITEWLLKWANTNI
ncbi:MAG: hypothetical protein GY795_20660 [Desulfobacterales bacterium]|nr:hypothetical protein [Desulfobacterales bacterium]